MKKVFLLAAALAFAGFGCPLDKGVSPPGLQSEIERVSMDLSLKLLEADTGQELPGGMLKKKHKIGTSSCPDPFPALVFDWPNPPPVDLQPVVIVSETDAPWLNFPEAITPGEPFTPEFNCQITDYSSHTEDAEVFFRIEGHVGQDKDEVADELEPLKDQYNLPLDLKPLKIELDVAK